MKHHYQSSYQLACEAYVPVGGDQVGWILKNVKGKSKLVIMGKQEQS